MRLEILSINRDKAGADCLFNSLVRIHVGRLLADFAERVGHSLAGVLLFGASRQHFGRDRFGFAKRLQPISRRDGSNRHQMLPAFLDGNKKELEIYGRVNESKVTIKCLLFRIYMVHYPAGRTRPEMTEIRCNGLLFD